MGRRRSSIGATSVSEGELRVTLTPGEALGMRVVGFLDGLNRPPRRWGRRGGLGVGAERREGEERRKEGEKGKGKDVGRKERKGERRRKEGRRNRGGERKERGKELGEGGRMEEVSSGKEV